eukprot:COSAG02_NODE_474_length_21578_cov_225.787746_8_plen_58_part_00
MGAAAAAEWDMGAMSPLAEDELVSSDAGAAVHTAGPTDSRVRACIRRSARRAPPQPQ